MHSEPLGILAALESEFQIAARFLNKKASWPGLCSEFRRFCAPSMVLVCDCDDENSYNASSRLMVFVELVLRFRLTRNSVHFAALFWDLGQAEQAVRIRQAVKNFGRVAEMFRAHWQNVLDAPQRCFGCVAGHFGRALRLV